jgi:signal transduction histidine kinase
MRNPSGKEESKYRALADAALAASEGKDIDIVAEKGLAGVVDYIGLTAGALILWDSSDEIVTRAVVARNDEEKEILNETENTLLMMLRRNFKLRSAYMDLGGEKAKSVFFLPIEIESRQFGALIGVKVDTVRLHAYDEFLRALASVLALVSAPHRAIEDLAVGVNHEINNYLTPLLGNLELLEDVSKGLPKDVQKKLAVIQKSARRIKEVTARLKEVSQLPRVPYVEGEWMVDLSAADEDENSENEKDKDENDRTNKDKK